MQSSAFAVLADSTRRRILDQVREGERSVGEIVGRLGLPQPTVSKHLKVLKTSGLVSSRAVAQQRIYRVELDALRELDRWLEPYRRLWTSSLDALERHLDEQEPT